MISHGVIVRLRPTDRLHERIYFHQPSTELFEVVCKKMMLRKMEKFEVCIDWNDDNPVNPMGLELAI